MPQAQQLLLLLLLALPLIASSQQLLLFDESRGLGPKFEGIGAISGGGATSKLLPAYAAWHPDKYQQILDYLFKPNHGAALQILKVEIGGDSQSTDGAEASHMHHEGDLSFKRGYEWQLMRRAKLINKDLKLYGLPWVFPGWIGNGTQDPYHDNSTRLLKYIAAWIGGASSQHNLTIDYLGIWNERPWNADYIVKLRRLLNRSGFHATRLVATDSVWDSSFLTAMHARRDLREAVDIIGVHYPAASSPSAARSLNKTLICSEEFSAFNDLSGAGCWARILVESFVRGNFSGVIAWNLITSYYHSLPYTDNSIMSAREPWSGNFQVKSPIWITAHHTHFTQPGWRFLPVGSGSGLLPGNGSYLSYLSPDNSSISIVFETMDPRSSHCFYSMPRYAVAAVQNVTLAFGGSLAKRVTRLKARLSEFDFRTKTAALFRKIPDLLVRDGRLSVTLRRDTVLTLTTEPDTGPTADASQVVDERRPLNETKFPDFYSEDIHKLPWQQEPLLLSPQSGSWEVARAPDGSRAIAQLTPQAPIDTCSPRFKRPAALIGDRSWSSCRLVCDLWLPSASDAASGAFAALRVDRGGAPLVQARGAFVWLMLLRRREISLLLLTRDFGMTDVVYASAIGGLRRNAWLKLQLESRNGFVSVSIDSRVVYNSSSGWESLGTGWAAIGAADFGVAYFRNLSIRRLR